MKQLFSQSCPSTGTLCSFTDWRSTQSCALFWTGATDCHWIMRSEASNRTTEQSCSGHAEWRTLVFSFLIFFLNVSLRAFISSMNTGWLTGIWSCRIFSWATTPQNWEILGFLSKRRYFFNLYFEKLIILFKIVEKVKNILKNQF